MILWRAARILIVEGNQNSDFVEGNQDFEEGNQNLNFVEDRSMNFFFLYCL